MRPQGFNPERLTATASLEKAGEVGDRLASLVATLRHPATARDATGDCDFELRTVGRAG